MANPAVEGDPTLDSVQADHWPTVKLPISSSPEIEKRIDDILARMTIPHKVGQIIQADIASITPNQVREYQIGSVLNGGNSAPNADMYASPQQWLELADAFWDASLDENGPGIPILWGTDAVHGHSNVVGATIFPHNIGLGASRDADLVRRIGEATALEISVTGMDWTFAPTLAVTADFRWGRSYESYSGDPSIVAELGAALVFGLQGEPNTDQFLAEGRVIATSKHFVGDGGTLDGRDQGETIASEAELRDLHAMGYVTTVEAGVQSIMASFSSWNGQKMHGRKDLLTGVLKDHWSFDGVVIGDWNGHGQIEGCTVEDCPDALNAGLDLYMAPDSWKGLLETTIAHVESGVVSMDQLDEAVRRVLRLKLRSGVFEKPRPSERPYAGKFELLGNADHTELAREAVRKSAVLLKNNDKILPLSREQKVLLVGAPADDLSALSGGWTLTWQGEGVRHEHFPNKETIFDGLKRVVSSSTDNLTYSPDGNWDETPDVAVVVFGEPPYAEFRGDQASLDYKAGDDRDIELLRKLKDANIPTVSIFLSGRPLWVNREINASDAFIAAFLPGPQAGALADLIFESETNETNYDFEGRLPFYWPIRSDQFNLSSPAPDNIPLFPFGFGLTLQDEENLSVLDEKVVVFEADSSIMFDKGTTQGGWNASAKDQGGEYEWNPATGTAATTDSGSLVIKSADLGQQENAVRLKWDGSSTAQYIMRHSPIDLTREANGDIELVIDYAVEKEATKPLKVSLSNGDGAASSFNMASTFQINEFGGVSSLSISLKCLIALGVDLSSINTFCIETDGEFEVVISRIALAAGQPTSSCPEII